MNKKWKIISSTFLIICVILGCYSGLLYKPQTNNSSNIENPVGNITHYNNKIRVHYLDVGQADCIFIELPNNETMLIDAGESKNKNTIINYIKELGYYNIDYND